MLGRESIQCVSNRKTTVITTTNIVSLTGGKYLFIIYSKVYSNVPDGQKLSD